MSRKSSLPLSEAQLISLFLCSIAYGVYIVSAGLCARALIYTEHSSRRLKCQLMVVAAVLFVLTTADTVVNFVNVIRVFVLYRGPDSPEQQLERLTFANVVETADIILMSLIADGMLVYRCYIIFSRKLSIILLPALLWLVGAACGVVIMWLIVTIGTGDIVGSSRLSRIIYAFLVTTFTTNLLTTGLIVWHIYQIDRETAALVALPRKKRSRLSKAIRIVVESGLLYTTFVLLTLITEVVGTNAAYGVAQMMLVVIGISFNLIIIRVGQGIAVGGTYDIPTLNVEPWC